MKTMKIIRKFIALTAMLIGMIGWSGDSAPFLLDTIEPFVETGEEVSFSYNSAWIGGNASAEVVISANGTEIKRTTGEGEFAWAPTTPGKYMFTYTTYIDGVAQEEVYTATVFKDWKYTLRDGKATIVETTQTSGNITIPSVIDGYPVVGLCEGLFNGCEGLTSVTIPDSVYSIGANAFANCTSLTKVSMPLPLKEQVETGDIFAGCSEDLEIVYRSAEITNVVAKQRFPWNGKVDIIYNVTGNIAAGLPEWLTPVISVSALDRSTGSNYEAQVLALSGDTGIEEGEHHVVWDLNAQNLQVKSDDMVFTVAYLYYSRYCIIDLSSGVNATSYPVSYLEDVPRGGWTDEYKTTKLVLRLIKPGSFKMDGSYDVTLTKPYYMGVFEVTQKQYELVTGNKPSYFTGDTLPVEEVSWNMIRGNSSTYNWPTVKTVDSNSFVGRLQARTGLNFDLPTEAQWEYACRAGTTTAYYWGDSMDGAYAWHGGNSGYMTHWVGTKMPNVWGLYDMSGNVWEWCLDWYQSLSSGVDPEGASSGPGRVIRGGSGNSSGNCASSCRSYNTPSSRDDDYGFRLSRILANMNSERSTEAVAGAERAVKILYFASGESAKIVSRIEPLVDSIEISYNSSWIGGESSAEVVIAADGTEIKRTTGEGEFVWAPITPGKHTLTYTTNIDGVQQDEVYTATVFKDWKYTLVDGEATIIETTQTSGDVVIPSEIDGLPVVGLDEKLFNGCEGITSIVIPDSVYSIGVNAFANCTNLTNVSMPLPLKGQVEAGDIFIGCSEDLEIVYRSAEITNVVAKQRFPWNGKVDITYNVSGNLQAGLPESMRPVVTVSALDRTTGSNYVASASALSGDLGIEEGAHHIVWDLNTQNLQVKSDDMVFAVVYSYSYSYYPRYYVVDLSAGANATSYPITYLNGEPEGGWTDEYKTTKLVLRLIEPGSFKMNGSYDVTLTKPYYMGVFEVTQKQYELVTGNKPSNWSGDTLPVESVSWNMIRGDSSAHNWPTVKTVDSNSFVGRLQARTGLNFDLPTEAQWEYACRAGTTTTYYWGDSMDGAYVWYKGNSISTHTVGTRTPNAWGLYDMSGNVWEWCLDWKGSILSGSDTEGSSSGSQRVLRGGSWRSYTSSLVSSDRGNNTPSYISDEFGFRVVRTLSNINSENSTEAVAGAERAGEILYFGMGESTKIDSRIEPLVDSIYVSYNSAWIGGEESAEVVIAADGTEINRTTGEGEFVWAPITPGKHTLTYTTNIDGVQQDEVYTATVFKDWKYTVENGEATIIETTQTSGDVVIPSEIDGLPVVGLAEGLFNGYEGLTSVTIPERFEGLVDYEGVTVIYNDYGFSLGGDANWVNDALDAPNSSNGSLRSGKIDINENSWMEMMTPGPGRLTYRWKASSEYYEDQSLGIYRIYDYGYLAIDDDPKGFLDENYMTNGIAIGGHTSWQDVELDISGEGAHKIKWVFDKDEYDDPETIGEDCIWVDDIKFRPLVTLSFNLGGGIGDAPVALTGLFESFVTLPSSDDFEREDHVFEGWYDGKNLYESGERYEMPKTNVVLTAQWIAKRFHTFNLNGGVGEAPVVIKDIPGTTITLPDSSAFDRDYYTFVGWSDGVRTYSANASYTVGDEGVEFIAVWNPNTISAPVIVSSSVSNGGILDAPSATITMSCENGSNIYYTLDGSTPTAESTKYTGTFEAFGLGNVTIKAIAVRDNYFDSEITTFTYTRKAYTLAESINASGMNVTSTGASPWFIVLGDESYDGSEAIRSGAIGAGETSTVEMTVEGNGAISFWWKVSSHEDTRGGKFDYVAFFVDDVEVAWISGEKDWANVTYMLIGAGSHTLKWVYKKNGDAYAAGEDCAWLDEVAFEKTLVAIDEPVVVENLVYNGLEQMGVIEADGYTLSGVSTAIDAGEYTATATLADGYKWADGSMDDKTITWSIAKATNEWITEPKISLESWTEGETVGELTDGVAKFGEVTATISGVDFTALPIAPGSYTIAYSVAETGNYSGLAKYVTFEIIKYVPIIISEITYENLHGATHANPETYQEGTVVEFANPSEVEGYTFAGWTPERISADMAGVQTVRANWTANNYTIAYNANEGTGTMAPTLATYDSAALVKDNEFVRDGYTFKGWALEESGDVVYVPGQSVMNLTAQADGVVAFYAVWERILIAVDEPVAAENLIYNGTEQVGVGAADGYTLSGESAAIDAGEYTATATLADGYKWADGSMEDKTITWSIAKATNEWITEPKISIESWTEGDVAGELTDGVAKFGEVIATINGAAFTELPTAIGSYSIEYKVAETGNYSELTKLVAFEIVEKPNPVPAINPDWGYVVTELGENKNEVAIVFTNHTEKAMTWTVPVNLENVQFLVVGGGGGGGSAGTGGGGGGGGGGVVTGMLYRLQKDSVVSAVVGDGGAGGTRNSSGGLVAGSHGGNSKVLLEGAEAVTAYGGARAHKDIEYSGGSGSGSYGAGKAGMATKGAVASGAEELVYGVELFGNNGGGGYNNKLGGGGGGAYPGDAGKGGTATSSTAGRGGAGLVSDITGSKVTYGSGGGGSAAKVGAEGGEGAGNGSSNKNAAANQGGGGGGADDYSSGGAGGSGIVVIRYTIPGYLLPDDAEALPEVTDDSKVPAALEGSADAKLAENITDAETYMAFREWALNLEGVTPEEVKSSLNAWLSYALNMDALIIAAPKEGDVIINAFESAATEGAFEFTVKIDGITVGENALEANLKRVFDIEGAETLANGGVGFSTDNVEVNTVTPESGNVKFSVTPKKGNGEKPNSFFFRAKMK